MTTSMNTSIIAALALVLASTSVAPAALMVDFNDNDEGPALTQAGFTAVTQSGGTFASDVGLGGMVTISVIGSNYDDRDRDALTGGPGLAQSDLLRDFIFRNTGTGMGVTLTTLNAGTYRFDGFFHDSDLDQGNGSLGVDVGSGEVLVVPSFAYSTDPNPATVGTAGFVFTADGINPVSIFVRDPASTSGQPYVINGFTLALVEAVPEPSTLALCGIALAGLVTGRRRRVR